MNLVVIIVPVGSREILVILPPAPGPPLRSLRALIMSSTRRLP